MTLETFSIAEARNRFTAIIRGLKRQPFVEVTRRGKPVAVLLSIEEYKRLAEQPRRFWDAYQAFRTQTPLETLEIEPEIFAVRDPSPGKEISL